MLAAFTAFRRKHHVERDSEKAAPPGRAFNNHRIAERFDLKLVALIAEEAVEKRLNASKSGKFDK